MELKDKTKTALDETRMLILGGQILLGFQFRSAFQPKFGELPVYTLVADGVALALMLLATALLIAPSAYHRLALGGRNTGRFQVLVCRFAYAALLPFALSLGLDLFIGVERIAGLMGGAIAGIGFAALALAAWYGIEHVMKRRAGAMQRAATTRQLDQEENTPLHARIEQMLTEARVILPGAQALLGFQLAIVLTESFEKLPASSRLLHGLALGCVAVAVVLLMAPAAYHRIVYAGEDAPEFLHLGGKLVAAAMLPLALGLAGDTHVVFARITGADAFGAMAGGLTLLLLLVLWYAWPVAARRRRPETRRPKHSLAH